MNKLFEFLLFFYFFLMLSNINHLHHSFSYKKKKLETSITIPSLPLLNSTRNINQLNKNNVSIGFNNISGIDYDNTRIFFDSMVIPRTTLHETNRLEQSQTDGAFYAHALPCSHHQVHHIPNRRA